MFRPVSAMCLLSICVTVASAQVPKANVIPKLVPGGADKVHDILGVSPGMSCEEAHAVLAAFAFRFTGHRYTYPFSSRSATISVVSAGKTLSGKTFSFQMRFNNHGVYDLIVVDCLGPSAGNQVYSISRLLSYASTNDRPQINQVRNQLQEKYGPPSVAFSDVSFGIFFSSKGLITQPDESCGKQDASGRLRALDRTDVDSCSYALHAYFSQVSGSPGRVYEMSLSIRDYRRLEQGLLIGAVDIPERAGPKPDL